MHSDIYTLTWSAFSWLLTSYFDFSGDKTLLYGLEDISTILTRSIIKKHNNLSIPHKEAWFIRPTYLYLDWKFANVLDAAEVS